MNLITMTLLITAVIYVPIDGAPAINCDGDCRFTASLCPPAEGIAACPPEFPFGTLIELPYYPPGVAVPDGRLRCLDRGGAIRCTPNGCWIDIVNLPGPGQGVADALAEAYAWGLRPMQAVIYSPRPVHLPTPQPKPHPPPPPTPPRRNPPADLLDWII